MPTEGSGDGFKVGYKNPPPQYRFQPKRSGNPRGRQKGVRNLASDVKRTLEVPVRLSEQGKARRVSTQEAALLRLREKALKGDTRSLDRLLTLAHLFNNGAPPVTTDFDHGGDGLVMESIIRRIRLADDAPPESDGTEEDNKDSE